jgi:hypothetical protein
LPKASNAAISNRPLGQQTSLRSRQALHNPRENNCNFIAMCLWGSLVDSLEVSEAAPA